MGVQTMQRLAIDGGEPVRRAPFHPWPIWDEREEQALSRTLRSGVWGIGGEETELFEREFAAAHGVRHALTVPTGTAALEAALRACGVTYGDEVIVPSYTFVATAAAALLIGAVPLFADIDPQRYTMDPATVESLITERTRAIVPVHIGGYPADMDALLTIARRHRLWVVEDACQAVGARWRGRMAGAHGDIGTFSFQSSKNINSGEGGAVITDSDELARRCWSFKNCGRSPDGVWYQHDTLGDNFRMSQFQGALLRAQLSRMEEWAERRAANGAYLSAGLLAVGGIAPQPEDERVTRHGYHLMIGRYDGEEFGGWPRARFLAALQAEGVPCSRGYVPIYATSGVRDGIVQLACALGRGEPAAPHCPIAEHACAEEAVWIGSQSALLGTTEDMDDIIAAVAKIKAATR